MMIRQMVRIVRTPPTAMAIRTSSWLVSERTNVGIIFHNLEFEISTVNSQLQ